MYEQFVYIKPMSKRVVTNTNIYMPDRVITFCKIDGQNGSWFFSVKLSPVDQTTYLTIKYSETLTAII